jgi:D-serine deaminase-like pyridoxal phosphate-dependent protein
MRLTIPEGRIDWRTRASCTLVRRFPTRNSPPHGKTTMAPALFEAQLNAGAWGITVATAGQALACRAFGVPRVLLANELLDPGALAWIAGQLDQGLSTAGFSVSFSALWRASAISRWTAAACIACG